MPDTYTVDVHIPADLAHRLGGLGPALDRQMLEALALVAYQAGTITAYELRLTFGIETRHELDGFLKARGVIDDMTPQEWRREQETLDRLGLERLRLADAGPLNYLVLIGEIGITGALVGEVLISLEVRDELEHVRPKQLHLVRINACEDRCLEHIWFLQLNRTCSRPSADARARAGLDRTAALAAGAALTPRRHRSEAYPARFRRASRHCTRRSRRCRRGPGGRPSRRCRGTKDKSTG